MLNFLINTAHAQNYVPLAQLPGVGTSVNTSSLSNYLQSIFQIGIAVAAGLAVIMIVLGGIEYMSTDAIGGKEEGKEKITSALWGLLLALSAWLILNTINPKLLDMNLQVSGVQTAGAIAAHAVLDANGNYVLDANGNPTYINNGGGNGGDGTAIAAYASSGKGFPSTSGLTNDQALALVQLLRTYLA